MGNVKSKLKIIIPISILVILLAFLLAFCNIPITPYYDIDKVEKITISKEGYSASFDRSTSEGEKSMMELHNMIMSVSYVRRIAPNSDGGYSLGVTYFDAYGRIVFGIGINTEKDFKIGIWKGIATKGELDLEMIYRLLEEFETYSPVA